MKKLDRGVLEAARHGIERSPKWPGIRKSFLKANPKCAACGKDAKPGGLQAHHRIPFHYCIALKRPDLELDERNLIALCEDEKGIKVENHHLLVGHLDDFKSSNLEVANDAAKTYNGMTAKQIRNNKDWQKEEKNKMKPLNAMTTTDKYKLRKLMDSLYPLEEKK